MRVLGAAQDVGAANVLAPVIKELTSQQGAHVDVVACAEAADVFARSALPHRRLPFPGDGDGASEWMVRKLLADVAPDVLLLGTSWGRTIDKVVLRTAREYRIPSVSILDSWSHYRERFTDPFSGTLCLPTKVAVADVRAFTQAVQAGLPEEVLTVTGQPYLDALVVALRQSALSQQAQEIRRTWMNGDQKDCHIVLFVSEAFSQYNGPGSAYYFGYTEVEALEGTVEAIQQLETNLPLTISLVVKRHPRQLRCSMSLGPLAARRSLRLVGDVPAWPCILAADIVVGMSSLLLIEAALAGKPTVSFRPSVQNSPSFIGSDLGLVSSVHSVPALAQLLGLFLRGAPTELEKMQRERQARAAALVRGDAATRITRLVVELAETPRSTPGVRSQ